MKQLRYLVLVFGVLALAFLAACSSPPAPTTSSASVAKMLFAYIIAYNAFGTPSSTPIADQVRNDCPALVYAAKYGNPYRASPNQLLYIDGNGLANATTDLMLYECSPSHPKSSQLHPTAKALQGDVKTAHNAIQSILTNMGG